MSGKVLFYAAFIITAVTVVTYYMRSGRPARTAFKGMLSGVLPLFAAHFAGGYVGLYLPLNLFTSVISLTLGAPAVIIMALAERFLN